MTDPNRRIIHLRPRAGAGDEIGQQLLNNGYQQVAGNRHSAPTPSSPEQATNSPVRLPANNLDKAIEDFKSQKDPLQKQYALRFIAHQSVHESSHASIACSNIIERLVETIFSDVPVNRVLGCVTLNNVTRTEVYQAMIGKEILPKASNLLKLESDLQQRAVLIFTNLCCCEDLLPDIENASLLTHICPLLEDASEEFSYSIILLIQNLINCEYAQNYLVVGKGLQRLVDTVVKYQESERLLEGIALIFSILSFDEKYTIPMVHDVNALAAITIFLRSKNENTLVLVSKLITNLSADKPNQIKMMESGILAAVIELLCHENFEIVEHIVMALGNMSSNNEIITHIANIGGCTQIALVCETLNENLLVRASKLVANYAANETARQRLNECGAKKHIETKVASSNPNLARISKIAVNNLTIPVQNHRLLSETIPPEKMEQYHLHRVKVIHEILDTERTYCTQLNQCVEHYMKPLSRALEAGARASSSTPVLKQSTFKEIFSSIEIILKMHQIFLADLEHTTNLRSSFYGNVSQFDGEARVGDVFLRLIDCLRLYRTYISDYDRSIDALSDALEDDKFNDWVQLQRSTHQTLSLSSILITPIQRIPRYSLLLQDLLKHMSIQHPDYEKVLKALDGVLAVADYLEAEKGKTEAVNTVISIQEKLTGVPIKLVQPFRSFIREGEVIAEPSLTQASLKLSYFFLFNDILIQAKQKKSKYRYKTHYDLQFIKAVALPKESKPNSFRILTQDSGFTYSCDSEKEKTAWVNDINQAVFSLKKNMHNRRVASQQVV